MVGLLLFIWMGCSWFELFHRVTTALKTGTVGPVVRIAGLVILSCLLLGPLLLRLLLLTILVSSPHTANQRPCSGTGLCTPTTGTGIANDLASHITNRCPPGGASARPSLFGLLLRWCFRRCWRLHGIESRLLFGPGVTLKLILFHLVLALALGRIDDELLSQ
ncbi:MAG: hypothetical protein V3V76_06050 [Candidatus Adiutricales bacterium]